MMWRIELPRPEASRLDSSPRSNHEVSCKRATKVPEVTRKANRGNEPQRKPGVYYTRCHAAVPAAFRSHLQSLELLRKSTTAI